MEDIKAILSNVLITTTFKDRPYFQIDREWHSNIRKNIFRRNYTDGNINIISEFTRKVIES